MRVLQVGAGGFGAVWLAALESEEDARLVALVDRDPAALVHGVPGFTDLEVALASVEADMALVVVPPDALREVAER
jgi:predicted dehydrogenase